MSRAITYTDLVKNAAALAVLGLSLAGLSAAEPVRVDIQFDEKVYVPGEDIDATLTIVNFSGRELRLGERPGWLALIARSESGGIFDPIKPVDLVLPFTVPHGKQAKRRLKVGEFYRFTQIGRYSIQPVVKFGPGPRDLQPGNPARFDVVNPAVMHEQPFGIRIAETGEVESRAYTIQRITRARQNAFVKVSNQRTGELIGLVNLGTIVAFATEVKTGLDRLSNLHTLHHSGARSYVHHVITPQGKLVARVHYLIDPVGRKPQLIIDSDGVGRVIGGRRNPQEDDILPLKVPDPPALSQN